MIFFPPPSPFFPDTSGVVFDTRSKMVMSQGGTTERMKEKVGPPDEAKRLQDC